MNQRLGQPGYAHEQDVPVCHHRREDAVHDVLLPDDAALDGGAKLFGDLTRSLEKLDIAVGAEAGRGRKRGEEVGLIPDLGAGSVCGSGSRKIEGGCFSGQGTGRRRAEAEPAAGVPSDP